MFVDIKEYCKTESLAVQAFYSRRGGIDINPFRSDTKIKALTAADIEGAIKIIEGTARSMGIQVR